MKCLGLLRIANDPWLKGLETKGFKTDYFLSTKLVLSGFNL